jgi:hypothetical protein
MLIKSISTLLLTTAFLFLAACSQQEEATTAVAEAQVPDQTQQEQRAAARAARMALSEATEFNMEPLLDPNAATQEQLSAVAGLSADQVQAIIGGRPFATASQLHAAIGENMSDAEMFDVYSAVFVKVNLNGGDSADFMLVPTTLAPDHIAREFVEYRPYADLGDFSPEMRKYVSEKEVAFLERFVIID